MTGKVIDEVSGARAGGRPSDYAAVILEGERTSLAEERDMTFNNDKCNVQGVRRYNPR